MLCLHEYCYATVYYKGHESNKDKAANLYAPVLAFFLLMHSVQC